MTCWKCKNKKFNKIIFGNPNLQSKYYCEKGYKIILGLNNHLHREDNNNCKDFEEKVE